MIVLTLLVEGDTEETFVKTVLGPHLAARGVYATPIKNETSRSAAGRRYKGGGLHWAGVLKQLRELLRDKRADYRLTTLFDLYRLPSDFPGMDEHRGIADTSTRVGLLEKAMREAVDDPRFIPYIQRHEFESLVLACLDQLEASDPAKRAGIKQLRINIAGLAPEDVDDGAATAPSKRLEQFVVGYRKVLDGPLVTSQAGLDALRRACPRFGAWLTCLEALAQEP